jgi:glycosyltransferase involved in cell wall biosynthesis
MLKKLLFISRWFPYPPDNGSKIRIFNLLKQLASQYEIHLVSFIQDGEATPEAINALLSLCASVDVVPYPGYRPTQVKALLGFFSSAPRFVVATRSLAMKEVVEGQACKHMFDVVVASQMDMASYALPVKAPVRVLEELEISGYIDAKIQKRTFLGRWRQALTLFKTRRYFGRLASRFDGVTVVSERERQEIKRLSHVPSCVEVIPNGVDISGGTLPDVAPEPGSLIYSGSVTYFANLDAVRYFLEEIFPLVLRQSPQVKFYVTGRTKSIPPAGLSINPSLKDNFIFTGYLPDIRQKVASSWASVVPLRQGGGTRLKILESLAVGTPVIATSKGAEGLSLVPERDYLLADSPPEFAAQILRLLEDPVLRTRLSEQGRKIVGQEYDWNQIGQRFNDFLERVRLEQRKV